MSPPASTKASRKPNLDVEDGIEYPSSDGKPMGETSAQAREAEVARREADVALFKAEAENERLRREIETFRRRPPEGQE
jgi:hypothetical protein